MTARRRLEAAVLRDVLGNAVPPRWWRIGLRWIGARARAVIASRLEDRGLLERVIIPHYLADAGVRSVLFVGCDWYTQHYERALFRGVDYWTIDVAPERSRFGARQHVVAPLEQLERHFPAERFDWILCNGVYGWGLDAPDDCEAAFAACLSRLRPGGHLLLGWNALPGHEPVPLEQIPSLRRFEPHVFAPLGTSRHATDTAYRHMYAFYRKPLRGRRAVDAGSS